MVRPLVMRFALGVIASAMTVLPAARPAAADPCGPRGALERARLLDQRVPAGVTTTDDSRWDARFRQAGIGHGRYEQARVMAGTATDLYVGGAFWRMVDVRANGIARFDGSTWSSPGGGIDGFSEDGNSVDHLATIGSDVYASGYFYAIGGVPTGTIARWDGSQWHALGFDGLPGEPPDYLAIFAAGGKLYTTWRDSSSFHDDVYVWNDGVWSFVAGGIDGQVSSMAAFGESLVFAGEIVGAGGKDVANIALWDGEEWSTMNGGTDGVVDSLAVVDGALHVAGWFEHAGGVSAQRFATWNGSAWTGFDAGAYDGLTSLTVAGADLYALAYTSNSNGGRDASLVVFDGSQWTPLGDMLSGWLYELAAVGATLYAIVDWHLYRWDAGTWTDVTDGDGTNGDVHALEAIGDRVYAGGLFADAGPDVVGCIGAWDGSDWESLEGGFCSDWVPSSEMDTPPVRGITSNGEDVYTIDEYARVSRWNGAAWDTIRESGYSYPAFGYGYAAAFFDGRLYIGGRFKAADGVTPQYLLEWDGEAWLPAEPGPNGPVNALEVIDGALYVGGDFSGVGAMPANNIARLDDAGWTTLGRGMDGSVHAIAGDEAVIYAGGEFTSAGCGAAAYVARWDGLDWWPVGAGVDRRVLALAMIESDLYAGGDFSEAGGAEANHVARWNGVQWESLGSGTDAPVYALAVLGSDLYVGGGFFEAGRRSSTGIALWHTDFPTTTTTTTTTTTSTTTTSSTTLGPTTTTTLPHACAQPVSTGPTPVASDCLYILSAAVGVTTCNPACICAPKGTLPVSATDALICLNAAVGTGVALGCSCS